MPPRPYNIETRRRQQAELRARIAAAAAQLHAEHGAVATSYSDIARRAGVSLPTIYNHFSTQEALIGACTGHAAALAPPLPVEQILAASDVASAAQALVAGTVRLHEHFEPWLVWREHRLVPALGALTERRRVELTALAEQVLRRHVSSAAARRAAPVWEALLHFELWHRLARQHNLPPPVVQRTLVRLLLAALASASDGGATRSTPRR